MISKDFFNSIDPFRTLRLQDNLTTNDRKLRILGLALRNAISLLSYSGTRFGVTPMSPGASSILLATCRSPVLALARQAIEALKKMQ